MAYLRRGIEQRLKRRLESDPVAVLEGARATGKTSLAEHALSEGWVSDLRSFANTAELAAAKAAPEDYVAQLPHGTVIDEAQLFEAITVAVKAEVDQNSAPGRFLLTGSTRLRRNALGGSDPLAGRTGSPLTMAPLTLGERVGVPTEIVSHLFEGEPGDLVIGRPIARSDLLRLIVEPGLPGLAAVADSNARSDRARNYLPTVTSLAAFEARNIQSLNSLARYVAGRTSTIVNVSAFAAGAEIARPTVEEYLALLEEALLIRRLPGWRRSKDKSETDKAKLHFFDVGVAAALARLRPGENPQDVGRLVETLLVNDLVAQASWMSAPPDAYHWRQTNKSEVDLVFESAAGEVVCVEVKNAESVSLKDFRGIDSFRNLYPQQFHRGFVFYSGSSILPFGENRWALPYGCLFGAGADEPGAEVDAVDAVVARIAEQRQAGSGRYPDKESILLRDEYIEEIERQLSKLAAGIEMPSQMQIPPPSFQWFGSLSARDTSLAQFELNLEGKIIRGAAANAHIGSMTIVGTVPLEAGRAREVVLGLFEKMAEGITEQLIAWDVDDRKLS